MRELAVKASVLRIFLPVLLAGATLLGCGSGEKPGANVPAKPAVAPARKPLPTSAVSPNMVSAVSGPRTGASAVQVKFELRERPEVNHPLDIDFVILPGPGNLDRISGTVAAGEGLELADGAQFPVTERPAEGVPIRHSVKLLPKRDGIFTVNVLVSVDSGGQTSTQTFSVPVIVAGTQPTTTTTAKAPPTPRPAAASR
jgi:hypothetical protein